MTVPREEVLRKVRQWAAYAEEDLRLAQHAMTLPEPERPYRLVAYRAQQCAEKHLKAYLVLRGRDFPYTHNIARLLELCGEDGPWIAELGDAEELTPYAVTVRYPGEDESVGGTEASRAVEVAGRVRRVVRTALSAEQVGLRREPPGITDGS